MAYTFKHGDRPVDGYTIQRAVGKGGFGEVYYAVSDGGREVAIKYLRDNPQIELRGVSNCINLKSPYLVAIFDVRKTVDDEYAIILEYCSGPSLRDLLIAEPNGFGPQKAAFFMREIGKGLAYLHDRGIVHRDLKPGNIFYDDGYVKIGDYGLSKFISVSRHSGQTASVGTVHYMAPEIGSGNYSKGVDIYALGVMLYEMLLGKVPFEGSSLAEVLMKHLTTQPEVDDLPQPFGSVIRKALQKDPKDRYQSVDEMVEALLDVDTVRDSLAGFSLKSLDGAVRYGGAVNADSPMPSPNPAPAGGFAQPPAGTLGQPPFALPIGKGDRLGKRVANRMDRISNKLENKLAKLSGQRARKATPTPPPPPPPAAVQAQDAAATVPALARSGLRKRLVLSIILSLGLAIGLGILVGNTHCEDAGLAAGCLVVTLSAALLLAKRAIGWFGVAYGPSWAQGLISLAFCAPMMALGALPLIGSSRHSDEGVAVWLGLLVLAVFGNWSGNEDDESPGEMRFGTAMWKGLWALVFTAIAGSMIDASRTEDFVLVSAGVAGVVSLITQANLWWLADKTRRAARRFATSPQPQDPDSDDTMAPRNPADAARLASETAFAHASRQAGEGFGAESPGNLTPDVELRWGITRAFWGLVSFAAMGGSIFLCLMAAIAGPETLHYGDRTGVVIGCVACFAFMLFALRKVSPVRRDGFWRESLRPFLQSAALFGIGATITGIARAHGLPGDAFAGLITGLVMCSLLLLVLTFFTGRKRRPRPFLQSGGSDYAAGDLAEVAVEQAQDNGAESLS